MIILGASSIKLASYLRLPAVLCALALCVCALLAQPYVNMGMNDEFFYAHIAREFARTGHLTYDGVNAMLGWMVLLGGALVRIFGYSYTVLRFQTVAIGMATAFLTQRSAVRLGLNEWNATLGTLTLVLSPLFLSISVNFMTDIGGLFCIVLCLYCCLRSLQSLSDQGTAAWLCFAALSNAAAGTVRQTAWLGVLVMVPSTMWLLRKRGRGILLPGVAAWTLSAAFIYACMHWFQQQPYTVTERFLPNPIYKPSLLVAIISLGRLFANIPVYLLPILIAFLPMLRRGDRKTKTIFFCTISAASLVLLAHSLKHLGWLAPFTGNYITISGVIDCTRLQGHRPVVLGPAVRFIVTVLTAGSCLAAVLLRSRKQKAFIPGGRAFSRMTNPATAILLLPFTAAYICLLLPRAACGFVYDRYTLPLFLVAMLFALRFFQRDFRFCLPLVSVAVLLLFSGYATAATHDVFALYRARLEATEQLRQARIPPTQIDGGFEYNGNNQIEATGYMTDPNMLHPKNIEHPRPVPAFEPCPLEHFDILTAIVPRYALSYDPHACFGPTLRFQPVAYRTWLKPYQSNLYIVKAVPDAD